MAQRLEGSPDLYSLRGPTASINFVTCHDGFTLADLFSYNHKHNEANGEDNRDGANDNWSWNCGWEGPTDDPHILVLRQRMMKNAIAMLMVSQGVPMILMGDEIRHTKQGNNNTYCQDNELSWFDWGQVSEQWDMYRFVQQCIAFRKAHPVLRGREHLRREDYVGSGYPDISWHGVQSWNPDWSHHSRTLAFMLCGQHAQGGTGRDDMIYVAMNMHWEAHAFELPKLPEGLRWHLFLNTIKSHPDDIYEPGQERLLASQTKYRLGPRSVVVLVGR
jgi:glycogen operon protein